MWSTSNAGWATVEFRSNWACTHHAVATQTLVSSTGQRARRGTTILGNPNSRCRTRSSAKEFDHCFQFWSLFGHFCHIFSFIFGHFLVTFADAFVTFFFHLGHFLVTFSDASVTNCHIFPSSVCQTPFAWFFCGGRATNPQQISR